MNDPGPEVGFASPIGLYLERPGAYAVIRGADDAILR